MRTVFGAISLTVGVSMALAACVLIFRGGPGRSIGGGCSLAAVLLVAGFIALYGDAQPPTQRWLIVAPTVVGGLAGAILFVVTSGSGTEGMGKDIHRLWVRILGTTYQLETGTFETMYAKMLLWGVGIGLAYVGVASIAGGVLGVIFHRRTKRPGDPANM